MVSLSDPRVRALLRNARAQVRDPWVLLTSGLGAGGAWAVGIPVLEAGLVGGTMLASGALLTALSGKKAPQAPARLKAGSEQAKAVRALDGYLEDLRGLQARTLPDAVTSSAIEALVAADGARAVALQVAQAIGGLDQAIARGREVASSRGTTGALSAVSRMVARRDALLTKLNRNVDEVAEVYTRLLELSATVGTMGLGENGTADVEGVNASMESLSQAFAELSDELVRDPNEIPGLVDAPGQHAPARLEAQRAEQAAPLDVRPDTVNRRKDRGTG